MCKQLRLFKQSYEVENFYNVLSKVRVCYKALNNPLYAEKKDEINGVIKKSIYYIFGYYKY